MANTIETTLPHVVIIGGGFGGLMAALSLHRAPVRITLLDRTNHHLFQPLLYQVATAALSPAQIAAPIRHVVARQANCTVWMAEVVRIDPERRTVVLAQGEVAYDYLVVAAGATHSYFGHPDWADAAPGLKSIDDALEIRRRILLAFERAERLADHEAQGPYLTFVIVGGGPTGVEMAGAIAEIAFRTARRDFRNLDVSRGRVVLVEAGDRLLGGFPEPLARRAERDLRELGVEVSLRHRVTRIEPGLVVVEREHAPERLRAETIIWAAGVQASPLGAMLGTPLDPHGRVFVRPDLSVPGHPEIFVIGDLACVTDPATAEPVPGVAPAALQMGRHVATVIVAAIGQGHRPRPPFRYTDRGLLATIGRKRAVAVLGRFRFAGVPAWLLWCLVHIFFLITFRQKLLVMIEWIWSYVTFTGGARLITDTRDR